MGSGAGFFASAPAATAMTDQEITQLTSESVIGCIESLWLSGLRVREIALAIGPNYEKVAAIYGFPNDSPNRLHFRGNDWEDPRHYPAFVEFVLMQFLRREVNYVSPLY